MVIYHVLTKWTLTVSEMYLYLLSCFFFIIILFVLLCKADRLIAINLIVNMICTGHMKHFEVLVNCFSVFGELLKKCYENHHVESVLVYENISLCTSGQSKIGDVRTSHTRKSACSKSEDKCTDYQQILFSMK